MKGRGEERQWKRGERSNKREEREWRGEVKMEGLMFIVELSIP